ncbi:Crp/Fnr family transcriptional regulator [Pseudoflavonifractor phocaeensis]|uniref:Crp/Fnr family transcriptional regulator n=1 Tax=Pseudoflavonifractor phocaeensis TaxID=1870988 RepID=UPI00195B733E|nr:Crp/Fnr family transcriptional regulator [Pseudoflavonifractor phocaeensis]MBM6925465.1 Crp/Fnr family transcriptional regulator [Pseudoflavonifractor phocaeensis]
MMVLKNPIFQGVGPDEYAQMEALGAIRQVDYPKESPIFHTGDMTAEFGVLLSGCVHIENLDLWGNRMILHNIAPGQAFAESYAFSRTPMMVDVVAVDACKVLFIHLGILLDPAQSQKSWYTKVLYNLLTLSTRKNLAWSNRMFCISSRHIRTRLMTYLSSEAVRRGSMELTIPFDRQQLADYLNVERSALSKELGRMKQEGILTFRKNQFRLLNVDHSLLREMAL